MTAKPSAIPTGAARLVASVLPSAWPDRTAILAAATRLDTQNYGDASDLLLDAWTAWHSRGEVPPAGPLCDLIATLAHLLGGVAHELRRRPRNARALHGRRDG